MSILILLDYIGTMVFAMSGVLTATEKRLDLFGAMFIGVVTMGVTSAVVGGVIRDTLTNEVPLIFQLEIYATACIAGALVYLLLRYAGLDPALNQLLTAGVIIAIRLLSIRFNWSMPILSMPRED